MPQPPPDKPPLRLFTVEEANELVPLIQERVTALQQLHVALVRRFEEHRRADPTRAARELADFVRHFKDHPDVSETLCSLQEGIEAIESLGCVFQGIELGLVDFPAERNDEVVFLCWQAGEREVGFWHPLHTGFRGRRPLDSVPGNKSFH